MTAAHTMITASVLRTEKVIKPASPNNWSLARFVLGIIFGECIAKYDKNTVLGEKIRPVMISRWLKFLQSLQVRKTATSITVGLSCTLRLFLSLVFVSWVMSSKDVVADRFCLRIGHTVEAVARHSLLYAIRATDRVPAGSCHFPCSTDPSQSVVSFPCIWK